MLCSNFHKYVILFCSTFAPSSNPNCNFFSFFFFVATIPAFSEAALVSYMTFRATNELKEAVPSQLCQHSSPLRSFFLMFCIVG